MVLSLVEGVVVTQLSLNAGPTALQINLLKLCRGLPLCSTSSSRRSVERVGWGVVAHETQEGAAHLSFAMSQPLPSSMKAIVFEEVGQVALRDVPTPHIIRPTDCIVKVTLCSICGSDLHPFHGRETGIIKGTIVGHEFVGTVVEMGSQVKSLALGDRVMSPFTANCGSCFYCKRSATCRCCHSEARLFGWVDETEAQLPEDERRGLQGSQAQYVRVPLADSTLLKVPDGVTDEEGILLGDILSTAFFCARNAGLELPTNGAAVSSQDPLVGDVPLAVILGCGPVGLLAVMAASLSGAQVWAVDSVPERLAMAQEMGATKCLDLAKLGPSGVVEAVKAATDGRGADAVLEVVGSANALKLGFEVLRPMGALSSVGVHTDPSFPFSPQDGYNRNLRYASGRCPARYMMEQLLPLVQAKRFDCTRIITHRLPLTDGVRGYDIFSRRAEGCIKIVLDPWT